MNALVFVPAIWSKKTTPTDLREYQLEGYPTDACGCMNECLEFAKAKGYSKAVFKTLERKKVTKVIQ